MAKTLYHSELVKMGPVQITVESDILQSKFKGKNDFVMLNVEGEERNYNIENEDCATVFDGEKGKTFTIVAEGSREAATVEYVGEALQEKAPARPPKTARPPAASKLPVRKPAPRQADPEPSNPEPQEAEQPAPRPAPETPEQKVAKAKQHANKVANAWLVAFAASMYARGQVNEQFGFDLTEEMFQSLVATICIQLERDGFHHQMPTGKIQVGPTKSAKPVTAPVEEPAQE